MLTLQFPGLSGEVIRLGSEAISPDDAFIHFSQENYRAETLVLAAIANMKDDDNVIYESPGLRLIGIPPPWTLALKLQRFTQADEDDIVYLMQEDSACAQYDEETFARMLEERLKIQCPQMEYAKFPERASREWQMRVRDCARKAKFLMSTPQSMLDDDN